MAHLHSGFMKKTANELQCRRPGFSRISRTEIEPDRVDNAPESNMILLAFLDQSLQDIVSSHAQLLSINELDLLDGDGLTGRVHHMDVNRRSTALGGRSITYGSPPVWKFDQLSRIVCGSNVSASLGQFLKHAFGFCLPAGDLSQPC